MRILYQFPLSHFCEKTRWNLDAKGLAYRRVDVVPGLHPALLPLASGGTVPVLRDGGRVVGDSSAIARYLDDRYGPPLLVPDRERGGRAASLEAELGQVGRHVVRVIYGALLEAPGALTRLLMRTHPTAMRLLGTGLGVALVERAVARHYQLDSGSRAASRTAIVDTVTRLERETADDPGQYLSGDQLSIADITAASLLGPLVKPAGSPWSDLDWPPAVVDLQRELADRPGVAWVRARWAWDREARHVAANPSEGSPRRAVFTSE